VKAILDANRNSLMLLGLKLSVLTLSITAGTFFAALYGMNLKNFIEESDIGFTGVSVFCAAFGAIVWAYWVVKIRKVQTLSMWGHDRSNIGLPRGAGWGLGGWGSRSRLGGVDCSDGGLGGMARLKKPQHQQQPGETFNDLMYRERAIRAAKK
jgi:magnesium transporter